MKEHLSPETLRALDYLEKKYPAKAFLNKKELADELAVSHHTISYYITRGCPLPKFYKHSPNAKVLFPLIEVAKFISKASEDKK
ncbi:MAG: hypothetical protein IE881_08870, partial [Epsilonproteobacteria bacterium]|nr:hypothetical protein [Campylobacterota bacterium]